jgi:alpha/beta superfamily hydrolase
LQRRKIHIKSAGERIETVVEAPDGAPRGLALIAHPHPLRGGNLDNKVAWCLAKAALASGLVAVRPNFRGVGASSGVHDHGIGETEDMLAIAEIVGASYAGHLPWILMGFSFGCYVQQRVAQRLVARQSILVGPAVSMYAFPPPAVPTTIIHGSADEVIPLAAVRDYAQAHAIPMHVVDGTGHFFHGRLRELQSLVEHLCQHP